MLKSWSSNTLANTMSEEPTHWKRLWCWERLKAGGEGHDRGWDGWIASPTQWTLVWASSRRLWRTGRPGVLQSMGSQRVGHDWVTGQRQTAIPLFHLNLSFCVYIIYWCFTKVFSCMVEKQFNLKFHCYRVQVHSAHRMKGQWIQETTCWGRNMALFGSQLTKKRAD